MFPSLRVAERRSRIGTAPSEAGPPPAEAAELALRFRRRAQTVLAENPISDLSLGSNVARRNTFAVLHNDMIRR